MAPCDAYSKPLESQYEFVLEMYVKGKVVQLQVTKCLHDINHFNRTCMEGFDEVNQMHFFTE